MFFFKSFSAVRSKNPNEYKTGRTSTSSLALRTALKTPPTALAKASCVFCQPYGVFVVSRFVCFSVFFRDVSLSTYPRPPLPSVLFACARSLVVCCHRRDRVVAFTIKVKAARVEPTLCCSVGLRGQRTLGQNRREANDAAPLITPPTTTTTTTLVQRYRPLRLSLPL